MSTLYTIQGSRKKHINRGGGIVDSLINKLPFELHIPGYNYCGPGTKLEKRLARGDHGINPLDEACKDHDIAYSQSKDIKERHQADTLLAHRALERFKAHNASFGEKTTALGITGVMKIKTKLGMGYRKKRRGNRKFRNRLPKLGKGLKKRRRRIKKGKGITLTQAIRAAKKGIKGKKFKSLKGSVKAAMSSLKNVNYVIPPRNRILPIPKSGGFLPLIPLFAGLSALGALGGGAAGIAKAVNDAKAATNKLAEAKRHNESMESIALGKKGSGLYLKPYKSGCGLFLKPYSKNC